MATAVTYPKISRKLWWLLRERFKKSIPTVVTPTLVNSLSPMTDASARSNVISPLRELGLLDGDNKPTDWATRWRQDDEYAAVCHEIRDKTYPEELIEAFHDPDSTQKASIQSWFMKVGHVGEVAARMYADTYLLLSQADPNASEEKVNSTAAKRAEKSKPSLEKKSKKVISALSKTGSPPEIIGQEVHESHVPSGHRRIPAIHIDVQVHISPDTSPEQIDRIFESMAKHLGTYIK
jgi:hypothetical protein